jgi:4-amino-4-deoxy-L-arabinose transferase-like glycosyltransferase
MRPVQLSARRTAVVLAVPFLVAVAALRGLTATLPIFHGSDEFTYHLPTIRQFARELPTPDLGHYKAAQTPLFHLLLAIVGKVIGYELWRLRLVEVLISYGLAWCVYHLLTRRLGLPALQGVALTLLFVLSPYVYGPAFRAVTDNLATLFVVIAVERLERFRETSDLGAFVAGCAAVAAGLLTRQSVAFMLPFAGLYALRFAPAGRARVLALAATGLAAVPVGILFLVWHGLVPPGSDPSSCGLCAGAGATAGSAAGNLEPPTAELTLATVGLYGVILFAPLLVDIARDAWRAGVDRATVGRALREPAAGAALGVLVLAIWPAHPGRHAAGLLWNASKQLPAVHGTSLLFWVLVPLAGAVLSWRARAGTHRWLAFVFLGCFVLTAPAIRFPWQKYVDPFALLALIFTLRPQELARPRDLLGALVLGAGFVAYTLSFVV